jgi:hypothetical protein
MSQHDYSLANDTGQNFRTDANNALAAIVSNNSGATEPATRFAYQWWADTTTGLLKVRNSANSAWVTVGTLAAANLGLLSLAGGTLTGQLLAAALATVATPDIAFAGDPDTGMMRAGANLLALVANGVEYMRVDGTLGYVKHLGTACVLLPAGTTAQRPTGVAGQIRYNTDLGKFEGYNGSLWSTVGGGGGGAGFVWRAISGTAPTEGEVSGEVAQIFGQGLSQELYASVKVPASYIAGTQIFIYVSGYSPSAANTILMKAQSTLIRSGTDAFTSTTNQRTTTNTALTNTVANQLRQFALDVTDSSGQINGVAVAAGDVIKVRLYRDASDTDTADLNLLANATDAKFA